MSEAMWGQKQGLEGSDLKVEEGATRHRMQMAFGRWKRRGHRFSPEASKRKAPPQTS